MFPFKGVLEICWFVVSFLFEDLGRTLRDCSFCWDGLGVEWVEFGVDLVLKGVVGLFSNLKICIRIYT